MAQKVSTFVVRSRLGDMLDRVALRHDQFVIERKGRPLAALVPVEKLEQMQEAARRNALAFLDRQKTVKRPTDAEAMKLATEAKRWARQPRKRPRRK